MIEFTQTEEEYFAELQSRIEENEVEATRQEEDELSIEEYNRNTMDAVRQQLQNAEDDIEDFYLEEEEELEELELDEPTLNEAEDTPELTLATV